MSEFDGMNREQLIKKVKTLRAQKKLLVDAVIRHRSRSSETIDEDELDESNRQLWSDLEPFWEETT